MLIGGLTMDDGSSALRNKTRPPRPAGPPRGAGRGTVLPHHRRRRLMALGLLAAFALVAGAVVGAGAAKVHRTTQAPTGYFSRIHTLAGTGTGSLAAAEESAGDAAIDRTLAYTPYVRIAGSQHREIALTFDDGPGPYTPRLLDELQRLHVPATFFEIGFMFHWFHTSASRELRIGDVIGDHTETHPMMAELSSSAQQSEIVDQTEWVRKYGGPFPRLWRPPYGSYNATTLAILHHEHMLMVLWTVDTDDYLRPGVGVIVQTALVRARAGAIILMHDGGGDRSQTIAALPLIVNGLRKRGYKLVTVPQLILDDPPRHIQPLPTKLAGD